MATLPEYIGHPQSQLNVDGGGSELFCTHMKEKFVYAEIIPKLPTIQMDANVWRGTDAWSQWCADLMEACGAGPGKNKGHIKVVISKLMPVTETFGNDYGSSEILPTGNMMNPKIQELLNLTGAENVSDLKKIIGSGDSFLGDSAAELLGAYESGVDRLQNMGLRLAENSGTLNKMGASAADAASKIAKSPWSKINWPQMWKNCNYQSQYNLQARLYCYNCATAKDYDDNIRASLAALQLFVAPKSKDAILYLAPYVMDFKIPGVIHMPLAYCSSLNVIKGGENGDFAADGRPNIIDISMNIQNAYSICVNTPRSAANANPDRPSLFKDSDNLRHHKEENKPNKSVAELPPIPDKKENNQQTQTRKEQTNESKQAAEALANATK